MAEEDDVTIKIAGDVASILQALQQTNVALASTADAIGRIGDEPGLKDLPKTFQEGTTAGVFFGQQVSKAFEQVVDMAKDAARALPEVVKGAADLADGLRDMSNRTGVSVESLSELRFVASQTGTDLNSIARVIGDMGKNVAKGSDDTVAALKKIGISSSELKAMAPEDAFVKVLEEIGKIPNAADRAAAGTAIFGNKFRTISQLATEDVRGLQAQAKALGLTISGETATQADRFNDSLDVMAKMTEAAKNKIGFALLPILTELAEKAPAVGGTLLLVGQNSLSLASSLGGIATSLLPLSAGMKTLGGFATTLGNTMPILTARVWLLDLSQKAVAISTSLASTAFGAFVIASGPVIVAIAAVTAAVTIGYQAWQWYGEAQARAAADGRQAATDQDNIARANEIAAKKGWQAAKTIEQASAIQQRYLKELHANAPPAISALGMLAGASAAAAKELNEFYAKAGGNRASLAASFKALDDGVISMKELKEATGLSEGALALYKKQFKDTEDAIKKLPITKFKEDLAGVTTEIKNATAAHAPMKFIVEEIGKSADDVVKHARLIPGALALVPPEVQRIAEAFRKAELEKIMAGITVEALKSVDGIGKQIDSYERLQDTLATTVEFAKKLALAQLTGQAKVQAEIDAQQQAEMDKLGTKPLGEFEAAQWEIARAAVVKYYGDARALATGFTGNLVRDMETRGFKQKEELLREAAVEKTVLDGMVSSHTASWQQIADQRQKVADLDAKAATKSKNDWLGTLDAISQGFAQMAGSAGESLGKLLGSVSQITGALRMAAGAKNKDGSKATGGILGPMFDADASSAEKWSAGIAGASQVVSGAMNVWSASAQDGSKAAGAFHGAMAGAQAGAAFGPYGMAIGAAAGAVMGFVHTLSAGRREVKAFAESMDTAAAGSGFDELRQKMLVLGDEGERLWKKLTQGTKKGDKAGAQAVIKEIQDALDLQAAPGNAVSEAGYKTIKQLQATADTARKVYETMKSSGEYSAAAVQDAWERSEEAQRAALGVTAEKHDEASAAIAALNEQIDALTKSIENEAPEEVMGDVQKATVLRIEELTKQREEQDRQLKAASEAASTQSAAAADEAATQVDKTGDAVDDMADRATNAAKNFEDFADRAVSALKRVQSETDAVSLGHSPGGIRQIPVELKKSMDAVEVFSRVFARQMIVAKAAADSVELPEGGSSPSPVAIATATTQAAEQEVSRRRTQISPEDIKKFQEAVEQGRPNMAFDFAVTAMNADGVKQAVEREILPLIIDAVDRNNRGAQTKLKHLLVPET